MRPALFIIDDDPDQLALLTAQLERSRRFQTEAFASAADALRKLEHEPPDAVVCDLIMPDMDGVEFTRRVREIHETLPVIIATARGTSGDAERALQAGATDFVTKPIETVSLITRINRSLEEVPKRELLSSVAREKFDPHGIVGSHPLIEEVRSFIHNVAAVPQVSVLLLGESGTGKNLVARAIHGASPNAARRFVEINCAALPSNLLEAELFGYEKGAFTDAKQAKKGLAEVADGGTLFLDEIGTISPDLQAKLLTFLESRTFRRIGATSEITVQLRIIAATNVDLQHEVAKGTFREDLYYRLYVASHVLPSLREVSSDIPEMATHFVERAAKYFGKPVPTIEPESVSRLQRYGWPGNARELRNVVERSMIFSRGPLLKVAELSAVAAAPSAASGISIPRGRTLEEVERLYIEATLKEMGGNINAAADQLGISRKVLWQRRRKHGLLVDA
jgi:two-component system, NtrC family, response regulator AtoC